VMMPAPSLPSGPASPGYMPRHRDVAEVEARGMDGQPDVSMREWSSGVGVGDESEAFKGPFGGNVQTQPNPGADGGVVQGSRDSPGTDALLRSLVSVGSGHSLQRDP